MTQRKLTKVNPQQEDEIEVSVKSRKGKRPELTLEQERKRLKKKSKRCCWCCSCCCSLRYTVCCLILFLITLNFCSSIMWAISYSAQVDSMGKELRTKNFESLSNSIYSRYRLTAMAGNLIASSGGLLVNSTFSEVLEFAHQSFSKVHYDFPNAGILLNDQTGGISFFTLNGNDQYDSIIQYPGVSNPPGYSNYFRWNSTSSSLYPVPGYTVLPPITNPPERIMTMKQFDNPSLFADTSTYSCNYEHQNCSAVIVPYYSFKFDKDKNFQSSVLVFFQASIFSNTLEDITRSDAFSFLFFRESTALVGYSGYTQNIDKDYQKYKLHGPVSQKYEAFSVKADEYTAVSKISRVTKSLKSKYGDKLEKLLDKTSKKASFKYKTDIVDVEIISVNNERESFSPTDVVLVHMIRETAFSEVPIIIGSIAGVFTLAVSALSIILSCCLCCCISRPIKKIIKQMKYAQELKFDKIKTNKFTHFSELRKIQSMFYYLTLSLKQYRSFLPAHVLQSIEFKEKKSRKRSNKTKTVFDEEMTEKTDTNGSHSDRRSFASKSVASGQQRSENMQFNIGTLSRRISVVLVKISNIDSFLRKTSPTEFINMHSVLTENINAIVSGQKATMHTYDHEHFLISFNSVISCKRIHAQKACLMAMTIKKRIESLNYRFSQDGFIPLRVVISISTGDASVSILGTSQMKTQTIHGEAVQIARILTESSGQLISRLKSSMFHNCTCFVILSEKSMQELPKHQIQAHALDMIFYDLSGGEVTPQSMISYILHSVSLNQSKKSKEWNYVWADDEKEEEITSVNESITEGWRHLQKDDPNSAQDSLQKGVLSVDSENAVASKMMGLLSFVNQEYNGSFATFIEEAIGNIGRANWNSALLFVPGDN